MDTLAVKDVMRTDSFVVVEGTDLVLSLLGILKEKPNIQLFIVNKRSDNDEFGLVLLSH